MAPNTHQATDAAGPADAGADGPPPVETDDDTDPEFDSAFDEFAAKKADAAGGDAPPDQGRAAANGDDGEPGPEADADGAAPGGPEPPGPDSDEFWAKATLEEQRAAFVAARRHSAALEHRLQSDTGRIAALQRQVKEAKATRTPAADSAAGGEAGTDAEDPPVSSTETPEWNAFRDEYPELAGPVEDMLVAERERGDRLEKEVGELTAKDQEAYFDEQQELLTADHPDWYELSGTPEYLAWYNDQAPEFIKDAMERNKEAIVNAYEASSVFHLFKAMRARSGDGQADPSSGETAPDTHPNLAIRRKRQARAAPAVSRMGAGAASGPPDDFDAAFDYFAARRDAKGTNR